MGGFFCGEMLEFLSLCHFEWMNLKKRKYSEDNELNTGYPICHLDEGEILRHFISNTP